MACRSIDCVAVDVAVETQDLVELEVLEVGILEVKVEVEVLPLLTHPSWRLVVEGSQLKSFLEEEKGKSSEVALLAQCVFYG